MPYIPFAIRVAGKHRKQLDNRRKAKGQIPVVCDKAFYDVLHRPVCGAAILQSVERRPVHRQKIFRVEIAFRFPKADLEYMHRAAAGVHGVGVHRIGRNDKQLLSAERKALCVNHNFTTQPVAQQHFERFGIVQRDIVLGAKALYAHGIGHLRGKRHMLLKAVGQPVIIVYTAHAPHPLFHQHTIKCAI